MNINKNLTIKQIKFKQRLNFPLDIDPLDIPSCKFEQETLMLNCPAEHIRMVRIVQDRGFMKDPSNFMIPIPKREFAKIYESNEKVKGICCKISNLLRVARRQTGVQNLIHVYLLTGKRIKSFGQVPDFVNELIVSESERLSGVGFGRHLRDVPTIIRKSSKISINNSTARTSIQKSIERSSLTHIRYVDEKRKRERVEEFSKNYPVSIISRLLIGENLCIPDDRVKIKKLADRNEQFTDRFIKATRKENEESDFELLNWDFKRSVSFSPVKKSQNAKFESESEDLFSSGSESSEETKIELIKQISNDVLQNTHNISKRKITWLARVPERKIGYLERFGLKPAEYHKIYSEYQSLLLDSAPKTKGVGISEIHLGQTNNEPYGIYTDYLDKSYDFFNRMPIILRDLLFAHFKIENRIEFDV